MSTMNDLKKYTDEELKTELANRYTEKLNNRPDVLAITQATEKIEYVRIVPCYNFHGEGYWGAVNLCVFYDAVIVEAKAWSPERKYRYLQFTNGTRGATEWMKKYPSLFNEVPIILNSGTNTETAPEPFSLEKEYKGTCA